MKRDAAKIIFRTVVFAGAMLGANACSKKQPPTTPQNTQTTDPAKAGGDPAMTGDQKPADPCAGGADPCGRPRGTDDDGGGGAGRGFILS